MTLNDLFETFIACVAVKIGEDNRIIYEGMAFDCPYHVLRDYGKYKVKTMYAVSDVDNPTNVTIIVNTEGD